MIRCPRCGFVNGDSAMNCANCRVSLQWPLEDAGVVAPDGLQRKQALEPDEKPLVPEVKRRIPTNVLTALTILLLLAILGSCLAALWFFTVASIDVGGHAESYKFAAIKFVMALAVCIFLAGALNRGRISSFLLRAFPFLRKAPPSLRRASAIVVPLALVGGLGYGLMRGILVLVPEDSARSLIIQRTLGERDFSRVKLGAVDLTEAKLDHCNLSGAGLEGADLSGARLEGARLSAANLRKANLCYADLTGANLCYADLTGANLTGANLSKADLSSAKLTGADLSRANLTGASVSNLQLGEARSLEGATMPWAVHE